MKNEAAARAAVLLRRCHVAALGTLHDGEPSVTMAPYAIASEPLGFVLLVSGLASHTKDMLRDPRVGLMVVEPETAGTPPHALARISMRGLARPIAVDTPPHAVASSAYLERFPDVSPLFGFGDFQLFVVDPHALRVVLGFAQATSLTPDTLTTALRAVR